MKYIISEHLNGEPLYRDYITVKNLTRAKVYATKNRKRNDTLLTIQDTNGNYLASKRGGRWINDHRFSEMH